MSSRVYISTLGCDKNLVDSEALLGRFAARGVEMSVTPEDADIWVLNTCGFIDAARRDSLDSIAAMSAAKGGRKLVVTGCLTQEMGESIAAEFPGIDVIGGVGNFEKLIDALEMGRDRVPIGRPEDASYAGLADRPLLTPPHVAFVKIAEGCNFKCSFCRIPIIRGKQISRPVAEVAAEVRGLVERGVREVQLVAQNLSDYGRGCGEDLLEAARAVGRTLAGHGAVVLTGGRSGVMEAAARGAREAGGVVVGVLPDLSDGNPYLSVRIRTGMGHARNVILVQSAEAVVAVGGDTPLAGRAHHHPSAKVGTE